MWCNKCARIFSSEKDEQALDLSDWMAVDGKNQNDFFSFSEENPFHIVQTQRDVVRASFVVVLQCLVFTSCTLWCFWVHVQLCIMWSKEGQKGWDVESLHGESFHVEKQYLGMLRNFTWRQFPCRETRFGSFHGDSSHVRQQGLVCWIYTWRQCPCRETRFGILKLYTETVSMWRNSMKCYKLASTNIHIHATPFHAYRHNIRQI